MKLGIDLEFSGRAGELSPSPVTVAEWLADRGLADPGNDVDRQVIPQLEQQGMNGVISPKSHRRHDLA